jgi:hypothetical protein
MLLTLLGNLQMFGSNPSGSSIFNQAGEGGRSKEDKEKRELEETLLREDEDILGIIKMWIQCL